MITSMAAAIILIASMNTNPTNTDKTDPGTKANDPRFANDDSDAGIKLIRVLTFPIDKKGETKPVLGNWDPYLLRYLVPHADMILYGTVKEGEKNAQGEPQVTFTVIEVLRGKLKPLKLDTTQERWRFGGCGPELAHWPVGQACLVYLKYDKKKKLYRFIETGVPIQKMPYMKILDINHLREIIKVWDAEFAGKTKEEQVKHRATLNKRKQLIFDVVNSAYREHAADIKALEAMGVEGKKKFEEEVIDSGVKKKHAR